MSELPIIVDVLSKIYKGSKPILALDKVSFKVREGEIFVILGPNVYRKVKEENYLIRLTK